MFDAGARPPQPQPPRPTPGVRRRRRCGFRFSWTDALVIVIGAAATWLLRGVLGEMVWLIPVVVVHFFLFCNVLRIRRSFELVWAVALVFNFFAWQLAGRFLWWNVLGAQSLLTVVLIVAEMRSRRYHGIGCAWINPAGHRGHVAASDLAKPPDQQVQHERQA